MSCLRQVVVCGSALWLGGLQIACGDERNRDSPSRLARARALEITPAPTAESSSTSSRSVAKASPVRSAPPIEDRIFRGLYLRSSDSNHFRPCGDTATYRVTGRAEALLLLRERFRFTAATMGRPLFAVFNGHLVSDSASRASASTTPGMDRRFFLRRVDTLRASTSADCSRPSARR
jgi:hypothetical protein